MGVSAGVSPGNGYVDDFDRGIFKVAKKRIQRGEEWDSVDGMNQFDVIKLNALLCSRTLLFNGLLLNSSAYYRDLRQCVFAS